MATITDKEFGTITLRRSAKASSVRIRLNPNGQLRVSLPLYTPVFLIKRYINNSRVELRSLLATHRQAGISLKNGMQIGKSHTLIVEPTAKSSQAIRHGQRIILKLSAHDRLKDDNIVSMTREVIIEALRIEAKSYLPKRLAFLANTLDAHYVKVRFSHASGRWGSCSTSGTISLNIALMKLPFELIDYVLIHELSHTKHMNHSSEFWAAVAVGDPRYKLHRAKLKQETPSI